MRHFPTLLAHELRMLAVSVATYSAAFLFLMVMGFIYFLVIDYYDPAPPQGELPSWQFFQLFWLPVLFMVPLLTMKSLAEERRHGTLEALLTTPATTLEIVLAKYFAAYFFYAVLWALTLGFPLIAYLYLPHADSRLLDPATLLGGYLYVALSGLLYIAVGIFASSVTRNTLVAGMLTFCLLLILIISGNFLLTLPIADAPHMAWSRPVMEYLQTFRYLDDFSRGILDTRPFFLYASNTLLMLGVTTLVVESRATN